MNMYWNQQPMSQQQNQFFQPPAAPGQILHRFPPSMGGQGGLPMTPGLGRSIDGLGGGLDRGMTRPQVNPGWNPGWGAGPQNAGGQGFGQQQQQMRPMPHQNLPSQGFPSQGYPLQQYAPQGYNQGYGGQMPVQPAWEEPKKSGIKGFISNLMAKRKR
ncbi:hypothetical protein E4K68_15335 [Desulfosporosinus sp. Sb-LF]|nr:hypothetical protein E4K68_15335 [Desulfosporosinus sp. Sb-LF]